MITKRIWIGIISLGLLITVSFILTACKEKVVPNKAPIEHQYQNFQYQKIDIEGKAFVYIYVPNTNIHQILPFNGEHK